MKPDDEELIRSRAYELWERAGRPEGDGLKYWFQAAEDVQSAEIDGVEVLENVAVLGESDEAAGTADAEGIPKSRVRKQADSAAPLKRHGFQNQRRKEGQAD